jgi:hypothetical protein
VPLDLAADVDAGLPANDAPLDLAVDAWWCTWSRARLRPANDAGVGCGARVHSSGLNQAEVRRGRRRMSMSMGSVVGGEME